MESGSTPQVNQTSISLPLLRTGSASPSRSPFSSPRRSGTSPARQLATPGAGVDTNNAISSREPTDPARIILDLHTRGFRSVVDLVAFYEREIEGIQLTMSEKNGAISTLDTRNGELIQEAELADERIKSLTNDNAALLAMVKCMDDVNEYLPECSQEVLEVHSTWRKCDDEVRRCRAQVSELQNRIVKLNSELDDIRHEKEAEYIEYKTCAIRIQQQYEVVCTENNNLNKLIMQHQDEIAALQSQSKEADAEHARRIQMVMDDKNKLKEAMGSKSQDIRMLIQQYDNEMNDMSASHKREVTSLKAQVECARSDNTSMRKQMRDKHEADTNVLLARLNEAEMQYQDELLIERTLRQEVSDAKAATRRLEIQNLSLQDTVTHLKKELEIAHNEHIVEVETLYRMMSDLRTSMTEECDDLRSKCNTTLHDNEAAHQQEIKQLTSKVIELENNVHALTLECNKATKELERLTIEHESLDTSHTQLVLQHRTIANDYKRANERVVALSAQHDDDLLKLIRKRETEVQELQALLERAEDSNLTLRAQIAASST